MDINIDTLYNILKKNQGDVNDAMGFKKKPIVVTSDPLALIAEKTKVSKSKENVVVSLESEGSSLDDFSELKKITALLAKAFNRRKFYSKPTNNNLRTLSSSQSVNKKQEFVKTGGKKEDKKADEKKRDMSKEINANMVFMAQIEKVLLDSKASSSSADGKISKKTIVATSDPLALIAEKINVSRSKKKLLYLRTLKAVKSMISKQEFVKTDNKRVEKKDDEKKERHRVKCYNCKKEGHFAKDCKKAKVKDYEYYKTKMLLAKKGKDEQVLLAEDQAWMESSSDSNLEINANMVFMAQIEKVL
nr:hypothetical protein [Tanacetum cinerariifolium]